MRASERWMARNGGSSERMCGTRPGCANCPAPLPHCQRCGGKGRFRSPYCVCRIMPQVRHPMLQEQKFRFECHWQTNIARPGTEEEFMVPIHEKILADPRFTQLVARRNRFAITLSIIVLAVYACFVVVAVFRPELFAMPVFGTSAWCVGLVAGFCIQAFAFAMTGIYTSRANGQFDRLAREAIRGSAA
ncbi:DUF485 domain-containing protein [Cereibacter sphaeroides]|nr:DUF485 domain-containing protein [Cereibacter sphaeroides]